MVAEVCLGLWVRLRRDNCQARGIAFGGIPVDEAIETEVFKATQTAAVEAAVQASEEESR